MISAALAASILAGGSPLAAAPALAAAPPSAEAQASLRKGFTAAQQGFYDSADALLTQSIDEWRRTQQPPDEIGAIYKVRGGMRAQQAGEKLPAALADLSESLPGSDADEDGELSRTIRT